MEQRGIVLQVCLANIPQYGESRLQYSGSEYGGERDASARSAAVLTFNITGFNTMTKQGFMIYNMPDLDDGV